MILITGVAGFIGFHLAKRLLKEGHEVLGIDNLNDYYDVSLKEARLLQISGFQNFTFLKLDIADESAMQKLFCKHNFSRVIHLAAQAGVRYSLINPHAYVQSNITGFLNVLQGCKEQKNIHLLFASSSSVYGVNTKTPFSLSDPTDCPASFYGATKKANEVMAHAYHHLYGTPMTALRFFTVYGPWGRPDMALYKFTKAILQGEPIELYNHGELLRDFTYIDDVIESLIRMLDTKNLEYKIYNIGNQTPVRLLDFVLSLEKTLGKKAKLKYLPMQPGDVLKTYADIDDLIKDFGYRPRTSVEDGIAKFCAWYLEYYPRKFGFVL